MGFMEQFMSPEVAEGRQRYLWPNFASKPAAAVIQKGVLEASTVDIGDHQARAVLLQPHTSAPVMLSHSRLMNQMYTLFDGHRSLAGRVVEPFPGRRADGYTGACYTTHQMPASIVSAIGSVIPIPLHGSFGSSTSAVDTVAYDSSSASLIDFTEVLNGGAQRGIRAIPCQPGDTISIYCSGNFPFFANGDFTFEVTTTSGAVEITTAVGLIVDGGALRVTITIPAGQVGIVSAKLVCAVARTLQFSTVKVVLWYSPTSTVSVSTGMGSYVGTRMTGVAALRTSAAEARVTAISLLISNTASAFNANGFIVGAPVPSALPGNLGIYGEDSIGTCVGSQTFTFVQGSYAALTPADDLSFGPLDENPSYALNRCMWIIRGQDATPVVAKLVWHAVVEVVSQDPLYPTLPPPTFEEEKLRAIRMLQETSACMILTENKIHWQKILSAIGSVAAAVGPLAATVHPALGAGVAAIGGAASTANKLLGKGKAVSVKDVQDAVANVASDIATLKKSMPQKAPPGRKGK